MFLVRKTIELIVMSMQNGWKWLVITDDDTLLSVSKLIDLLNDYNDYNEDDNGDGEEAVALGERFHVGSLNTSKLSVDFLAGGGGMVLNRAAVRRIMTSRRVACVCPENSDAPDDVHLGFCLASLRIPIVHTDRLHQVYLF